MFIFLPSPPPTSFPPPSSSCHLSPTPTSSCPHLSPPHSPYASPPIPPLESAPHCRQPTYVHFSSFISSLFSPPPLLSPCLHSSPPIILLPPHSPYVCPLIPSVESAPHCRQPTYVLFLPSSHPTFLPPTHSYHLAQNPPP